MRRTFTIEVDDFDVDVTVIANAYHNGIGKYEFWGQQCFDRGTPEIEIESVEYNKSIYTDIQNESILKEIDKKLDYFIDSLLEE